MPANNPALYPFIKYMTLAIVGYKIGADRLSLFNV